MTRLVAVLLPVSIFGLGAGSPPAAAQTAGKGPTMEVAAEVPPLEALVLMRLLQQPIDTKGLQEKVKLKTALEYFSDKFGGKLPMIVDREAFGPFVGPEDLDPYEEEVVLPPVPSKMLISTALRLILSQVGKGQATFVIRQSYIEITTLKAGTAPGLLYRPLIVAAFEKRPLKEVLQELANAGGLEIHLDPNIGKKADAMITARFRNSSTESALVVVTEMAELKYVVLEYSVYVTTPERAEVLRKEEAERASQRKKLAPMPKAKRLEPPAE